VSADNTRRVDLATYQWDSPYVGKYHATINGKRLEIERERGPGVPRYRMFADKKYIGDYSQLNGAKTKLIKFATGQTTKYTKNTLPTEMPSKEQIKAGLEAAGFKVSASDLDKASTAKVATITKPSGTPVKMTPAEVLRICAKHTATGQALLEETERTGEMPPVTFEIDDFEIDPAYDYEQPDYHYPEPEPAPVQAKRPEPEIVRQPEPAPAVQPTAPVVAPNDAPPGMAFVTITGFFPVEALKDVKDTVDMLRSSGQFTAHVKMPTDIDF
jgi:hypothetical protein